LHYKYVFKLLLKLFMTTFMNAKGA